MARESLAGLMTVIAFPGEQGRSPRLENALTQNACVITDAGRDDERGPGMAREEFKAQDNNPVSPELQLAVLRLWAAALQMEQGFSRHEIESVPGLAQAIQAVQSLPSAIGWDDVLSGYLMATS